MMYDVYILNDDFTTMEFVVNVLQVVFHKPFGEAWDLTMRVHNDGKGLAGTYTYDIASSKVERAAKMARAEGFPLDFMIEAH